MQPLLRLLSFLRPYWHLTAGAYVCLLLNAGFTLDRVLEPMPSVEAVASRADWADERKRPIFFLVRARRN